MQAMPDWVAAGHQARAGGRANRLDVKSFESGAGGGELIDVRRFDFAAVKADVGVAEIVGEEVDDVGAWSGEKVAEWRGEAEDEE